MIESEVVNEMENKIGKDFESLERRVVYGFTGGSLPGFAAVKTIPAPEESQRQLHSFLSGTAQRLYDHPEYIGLSVHPDDGYLDWELQNTRPGLVDGMRSIKKKVEDFYLLLVRLGQAGQIEENRLYVGKDAMKLSGGTLAKLLRFGMASEADKEGVFLRIDGYPGLFPAWKQLSAKAAESSKPAVVFARRLLSDSHPYAREILLGLIENGAEIKALEDFLTGGGYSYVDGRENEITADWYKNYGKKDEPLKDSWAEREHGGLSIGFDYKRRNQIFYGLRIPRFKELMAHFDDMDDRLKGFVVQRTKKCDNCGYCTQTDKTGTREKQLVNVSHRGKLQLCLLYPGFGFRWTSLDSGIVKDITGFLTFADSILKK